jgi:hypothetical protein
MRTKAKQINKLKAYQSQQKKVINFMFIYLRMALDILKHLFIRIYICLKCLFILQFSLEYIFKSETLANVK